MFFKAGKASSDQFGFAESFLKINLLDLGNLFHLEVLNAL